MDFNSSDLMMDKPQQNITPNQIVWVDPRDLLHPARLDVAVKALYANLILGRPTLHSGIDIELNYLKHILYRTGGKEPGDEARKSSLADFQQQFIELVHSMKTRGFLAEFPIPVSSRTGLILNGAHRLAAALCLGLPQVPVTFHDDVDGLTWNSNWFINQGCSPTEIDEFTRAWIALRGDHAGCVILWPTMEAHWAEIERQVQAVTPIAYRRTITLPRHAYDELMRDIYATDWGPVPGENIERKIQFMADYAPRMRFLVVAQDRPETLIKLKNDIRQIWHSHVPADRFATLHTTDNQRETAYIADLLLNRANLAALSRRPQAGFRPQFLTMLTAYHAALKSLRIDPEACCIVGSSVLEAFGVRLATDVDFTVTHQIRQALFTPGVTHLTPTLDVVAKDYPRAKIGSSTAPTDDDLIRDRALHVRVRGLKFADLDIVVTRKQTQRRFKDLMDVALVARQRFDMSEDPTGVEK